MIGVIPVKTFMYIIKNTRFQKRRIYKFQKRNLQMFWDIELRMQIAVND